MVRAALRAGLLGRIAKTEILPDDPADTAALLDIAIIQKAAYEVRYEIGHRPDRMASPGPPSQRMITLHTSI